MANSLILLCLLLGVCHVISANQEKEELIKEAGHLKPFGYSDKYSSLDSEDGFLFTKDFFHKYVFESKPLLMKNAAKMSKAFTLWTDEYFLNSDEPEGSQVLIEAKKKENRTAPPSFMSFKEYVRIYNRTDQYLVNTVPSFIARDVVVPGPLQCDIFEDQFADTVMWFSSGGTKSVVHTDSVENINCLFRGEKTLIFVNPHKYGDKVDLDRLEGSYSDMDVDQVDFTKYPGLAEVGEYYKVDMVAGDCLYIPYLWIHQVRSTGSNLAVNVWWDYKDKKDLNVDQCSDVFSPDFTLDKVKVKGFGYEGMSKDTVKQELLQRTKESSFDLDELMQVVTEGYGNIEELLPNKEHEAPIREIFGILDGNKDYLVSHDEISATTEEELDKVGELLDDLHVYITGEDVVDDEPSELKEAKDEL